MNREINVRPDIVRDYRIVVRVGAGVSVSGSVAEVDVTGGKENFPGRINPLPDHVEDVVTCALRKVNGEPVVVVVANDPIGAGQGFKVIPRERLARAPSFTSYECEKVAWIMRNPGIKDDRVEPGID